LQSTGFTHETPIDLSAPLPPCHFPDAEAQGIAKTPWHRGC